MRLQQGAVREPRGRSQEGRQEALGNKGANETNLSGGFQRWISSSIRKLVVMRRGETIPLLSRPAEWAWASGHGLGLEHDDVQVGQSLAIVNVFAGDFSDLQDGSSGQRLHLGQEACAAGLCVYLAHQEFPVIILDTDREFWSPRSIARLLGHLKV